ncbi:type IV pilus assembly protein FimV [Massilia rhizosphaerae]|uniref:type IV pilus assembly protein FimV n=1 Tax=Massilia rhizosphaerae TaxID=2784389 RepID=UPI0018DC4649|nr:hypothetical protein [Massilia rhizosphaerae]
MQKPPFILVMARRPRLFLFSLAFAALGFAHGAELGDPRVVSHIGQPLVADIELTMLDDAATPVQVRVASPEVYNGAGIAVPPVLSTLHLSVMRRDGRQFLHVTSPRAVDADHVHLYLELVDKGQRAVRLATLWLTPDPNPAPAPAPAREPGPVVVPSAGSVPARVPVPASVTDAALLAQVERARAAAPPLPVHMHARVPVRRPRPAPVAKAPALPVAHPDVHPRACAIPAGEAQACAVLGAKNDELRARLGQVEDRMKKLQVSLGAPVAAQPPVAPDAAAPAAAAAIAVPPPKPVKPAGPRPIHSIKPLLPHKPPPPPDDGLPWGWIGAAIGVLALGGAGAAVVVRRRRAGGAAAETSDATAPDAAAPALFDKLKARFASRTRAPRDEGAEPTID